MSENAAGENAVLKRRAGRPALNLEEISITLHRGTRDSIKRHYPNLAISQVFRFIIDQHLARLEASQGETMDGANAVLDKALALFPEPLREPDGPSLSPSDEAIA